MTTPTTSVPVDLAVRTDAEPELRLTAFMYEKAFEHPATIVSALPGGLTLLGHADDRFALAIPVKWGASVGATRRDDDVVDLRSGSRVGRELTLPIGELDDPPDWAAGPLAVVSSLLAAGHSLGGMSLLIGTSLPEGLGMQVEVGLTTVTASACAGLFGAELSLAHQAGLGELAAQLASVSCPDDTALLVDNELLTVDRLPFDLVAAGLRLMTIDLGDELVGAGSPPGASELAAVAATGLRDGNPSGLGPLFGQAAALDGDAATVAAAACEAGALGAGRLPGGCLIALVPVSRLSAVRSAVTEACPAARAPRFLTALASRGGRAPRE